MRSDALNNLWKYYDSYKETGEGTNMRVRMPSKASFVEHTEKLDFLINSLQHKMQGEPLSETEELYYKFFIEDSSKIIGYYCESSHLMLYKKGMMIEFRYHHSRWETSFDLVSLYTDGCSKRLYCSQYPSKYVKTALRDIVDELKTNKVSLHPSHIKCPVCKKKAQQNTNLTVFCCQNCSASGHSFNLRSEEFVS